MKTSKETKKNVIGFFLSLVGGLIIMISGFSERLYAYRYAIGMFNLFFGIIPALLFGTAILVCVLTKKRIATVILSVISLLYLSLIYQSFLYSDGSVLPLLLAVIGSVCGILGGVMIGRKS
jgi:hypothetical protein